MKKAGILCPLFLAMVGCVTSAHFITVDSHAPSIGASFRLVQTEQPSDPDPSSRAVSTKVSLLLSQAVRIVLTGRGFVDVGEDHPDFLVSFLSDMDVRQSGSCSIHSLTIYFTRPGATIAEVRSGADRLWIGRMTGGIYSRTWGYGDERAEAQYDRAFVDSMTTLIWGLFENYPSSQILMPAARRE